MSRFSWNISRRLTSYWPVVLFHVKILLRSKPYPINKRPLNRPLLTFSEQDTHFTSLIIVLGLSQFNLLVTKLIIFKQRALWKWGESNPRVKYFINNVVYSFTLFYVLRLTKAEDNPQAPPPIFDRNGKLMRVQMFTKVFKLRCHSLVLITSRLRTLQSQQVLYFPEDLRLKCCKQRSYSLQSVYYLRFRLLIHLSLCSYLSALNIG